MAYTTVFGQTTAEFVNKLRLEKLGAEKVDFLVSATEDELKIGVNALITRIKQERGIVPKPGRKPGATVSPYKPRKEIPDVDRCVGMKPSGTRCTLRRKDDTEFCKRHNPDIKISSRKRKNINSEAEVSKRQRTVKIDAFTPIGDEDSDSDTVPYMLSGSPEF